MMKRTPSPNHSKNGMAGLFLASFLLFGLILLTVAPVSAAAKEKIPTKISITITPPNPGPGDQFMVTGVLTTTDGKILGNKYVYLDSTKAGAQHGNLTPLWHVKTSTTGTYSFYRGPETPSEDLRVRFDGNFMYAGSNSEVVKISK